MSLPPSLPPSSNQEAQLSHIQRSVQAERARQGTTMAQARLQEVKGQVEQLLLRQYEEDTEGLELAKCVLGSP